MGLEISTSNIGNTKSAAVKNKTVVTSVNNADKPLYDVKLDGEAGFIRQGTAGDCRLLAELNGLSYTDWGRKIIKDAVKPDGMGGAIVTFKGAKGNKKEFRVTVEDFIKYKYTYSSGDDDVKAIEIASLKYFNSITGKNIYYLEGDEISKLSENDFIGLLAGDDLNSKVYSLYLMEMGSFQADALEKKELHPHKYVAITGFIKRIKENDTVFVTHHAYTIKRLDYKDGKKYVVLTEPSDSSKELYFDYNNFEKYAAVSQMFNVKNEKENLNPLLYRSDSTFEEQLSFVKSLSDSQRYLYMLDYPKEFIYDIDDKQFGWGNGKKKKALIEPFVKSVIKEAQKCKIDKTEIENFKQACYNELNATIYTNAFTILSAVRKMTNLITESYNKEKENK